MSETYTPEVRERGRGVDGSPIYSSERLYIQFFGFGDCRDIEALQSDLSGSGIDGTLYRDVNDPTGVGLACATRQPEELVTKLHPFLRDSGFAALTPKPDLTMLGRSYTIGYEDDLDHVLIRRPYTRLINPEWPWAVWYPLRRNGAFARLDDKEQRKILGEHGTIGQAFGAADLAHDIRLACYGMDGQDNDFVVALLGQELQPLSAVVQTMRRTIQTSQYIERLGPFFIGHVAWQSEPRDL